MPDLVLPSPEALARRLAAMPDDRLVALVRANSPGLSAAADALEAAALRELRGRLAPVAFAALCDASGIRLDCPSA